jgi:hypothetical protein
MKYSPETSAPLSDEKKVKLWVLRVMTFKIAGLVGYRASFNIKVSFVYEYVPDMFLLESITAKGLTNGDFPEMLNVLFPLKVTVFPV